ncbi:hypothetical protein SESBI_33897 [Sesbania bispinosa]|nr:hypothetical protein SESBI_33897 [Sesbania bispinosa]
MMIVVLRGEGNQGLPGGKELIMWIGRRRCLLQIEEMKGKLLESRSTPSLEDLREDDPPLMQGKASQRYHVC